MSSRDLGWRIYTQSDLKSLGEFHITKSSCVISDCISGCIALAAARWIMPFFLFGRKSLPTLIDPVFDPLVSDVSAADAVWGSSVFGCGEIPDVGSQSKRQRHTRHRQMMEQDCGASPAAVLGSWRGPEARIERSPIGLTCH